MQLIENMPSAEYHAHPALSRSTLGKIRISPKYLQWYLANGEEDKPWYAFGRALHTLLMEPPRFEESVAVFSGGKTRQSQAFDKFYAANPGKDVLLESELELMNRMADTWRSKALTRGILVDSKVESSFFWTDPATGVACKARPDILQDDIIYDIKTCRSAALELFAADARQYNYASQAAWYLDGVSAVLGKPINQFAFIAIEKEAPFDLQVFFLNPDDIEAARAENAKLLALYADCERRGEWPGYPETIQPLSLGVAK